MAGYPAPTYAGVAPDVVSGTGRVVDDGATAGSSGWDLVARSAVAAAKDTLRQRSKNSAPGDAVVQEWSQSKIRSATPHQRSLLYRLVRIDEDGNGHVDQNEAKNLEADIASICDGLNNYWTTLGVVAALIMSITVPYCMEAPGRGDYVEDDFSDDTLRWLSYAFAMLMFTSTVCEFLSITTAVHLYIHLTILMVDPDDKLWFMINNNIVIPQIWVVTGLILFLFAVPVGIFISYSFVEGCTACGVLLLLFLYLFWFNNRYTYKSYAYLDRKIQKVAKANGN
mmetsp:Transcript_21338/g.50626  ORF Transcript_21338/g.50626 Transcript_21338/m.50626 type:complete len:282 (-) Transcript_21338:94-939(-)|eukprot:527144-Rhodomonas_salina.2